MTSLHRTFSALAGRLRYIFCFYWTLGVMRPAWCERMRFDRIDLSGRQRIIAKHCNKHICRQHGKATGVLFLCFVLLVLCCRTMPAEVIPVAWQHMPGSALDVVPRVFVIAVLKFIRRVAARRMKMWECKVNLAERIFVLLFMCLGLFRVYVLRDLLRQRPSAALWQSVSGV